MSSSIDIVVFSFSLLFVEQLRQIRLTVYKRLCHFISNKTLFIDRIQYFFEHHFSRTRHIHINDER
jgi:hypothetical protein